MKGKETHPKRLDPPLDCQDVSRYQAVNPGPPHWADQYPSTTRGDRWNLATQIAVILAVGILCYLAVKGGIR